MKGLADQDEMVRRDSNVIKIDKDKVMNIVRLKTVNDEKTETVRKLKQELNSMNG